MSGATPAALRRLPWLYPHFVSADHSTLNLSRSCAAGRSAGAAAGGRYLRRQRSATRVHRRRGAVDTIPRATDRGGLVARRRRCGGLHASRRRSHRLEHHAGGRPLGTDLPESTLPDRTRRIRLLERRRRSRTGGGDGRQHQADLRRRPGATGRAGPCAVARSPADPVERPYARPCQRADRVGGPARRDHRRHDPPSLPDGASGLDPRRCRPGAGPAHPLAPVRRVGRPADPRHRHPFRHAHRRAHIVRDGAAFRFVV
jgi:hypothetical protein